MSRGIGFVLVGGVFLLAAAAMAQGQDKPGKFRRLPVKVYVDKMKAGWIGQMAGVGWGGPTEFRYKGVIIPDQKMPKWRPKLINQFRQDDIYVEMTFLRTLEVHGLDVSIRQAGIDFANSGYNLWHANRAGRDNLRRGIAPPDSGHPKFNKHADDIDYQIEADYSGLIAPGMGNFAIELGEKFGRLMNYGDGVYAGQFVGGLYAEAFFETDMVKIVEAGLKCIPAKSQYAEMVRDMLQWYKKNPDDWAKTWQWIEDKYHKDPKYTHGLCSRPGGKNAFSIDAKLNGAYIIVGLLYGKGDPDQTIVISTRCGQDSDCNPSNAGGVLFTTMGMAKLPERFTSALDQKGKFSHTPYDFPALVEVSKKLVRLALARSGGRVEKDDKGQEIFVIPVLQPKPSKLEQSREAGPAADSKFTEEEKKKITAASRAKRTGQSPSKADISGAVVKFAPGWTVADCGSNMDPGLRGEALGRKNVLVTHPFSRDVPCVLRRKVSVPAGKKARLRLVVAHHPGGDWRLAVKVAGKELLSRTIGKKTTEKGWATVTADLSSYAGKSVEVALENRANGWSWEAAYWGEIAVESE
ncbi:MAG: ADP-ribosylglycohydrolase family protein [Phycisphaerae bacterium]|nr:ADP-ribosylglycohydrolase family protein [Phycisphaerae bacterium]